MRLACIFILALSIHMLNAQAQAPVKEKSIVEQMRPTLIKIVGESWTIKLIGLEEIAGNLTNVIMPAIPKIEENAKSTAVYDRKKDTITIKPEIEARFNYAFIQEAYESTRQTKANDDEITKMMNVLSQGGTREGVYRMLVLDSVYGGMENWDKPVKSITADFAVYFYDKYLGRKVLKKSFEGMSIFTLKRLIGESVLEVADAFGEDRDGLERWYAVMSADLAAKFPSIWSNKTRKNTNAVDHKSWANKVPVQHIKSELVIKIHSAFNSMI